MKMHLNLATRDLDASVAFYSTLLGATPAKKLADYALFITGQPGLELALDPSAGLPDRWHEDTAERDQDDMSCCRS